VEPNGVEIRAASPDDADVIWELVLASFQGYSDFAPTGWKPPERTADESRVLLERLHDPRVWYRVATDSRGHAGQCGFNPAYSPRYGEGAPIPGLAHLWQLFVRRDLWGTGLAGRLHALAIEEMVSRGYERARLWTPAGQARARAFYERRGWVAVDEVPAAATAPLLLDLVEYRIDL
jgi:GNAT superfamily N-acetyltransferase